MELQNLPWYGQLAVFLVIGGLLFGIFYFVHYSKNQDQIERWSRQIDGLEKEIRGLEKKKSKIKEMQVQVEATKVVLEKLKEILPEEKEVSQNIKKIQSIINNANLNVQDLTQQGERPYKIYTEIPFSINLEGSYHNLGQFFDQLSKLKKIFTVSNLSMRPMSKMTRTYTIKASFTASTYIFGTARTGKKRKGRG
jgi:type IV pilus assembly protein PilO